jgi:hypothetical protein
MAPVVQYCLLKYHEKVCFKLGVNDDIWQDVGINDVQHGLAPLWLTNERVHQGIKSMLLLDRCKEEEVRLLRERQALQEWMKEEWKVVQRAKEDAGVYNFFCILVGYVLIYFWG